jgi:hypothetical protein
VEEGLVLYFGDARVMQILAVHETALFWKVTFVFPRRVVVSPARSFVVGWPFLRWVLRAAMATLWHTEVVIIFTFSHTTTGASVVGTVATEHTFVGVIDSVLSSQLVKFSLLHIKIRSENNEVLTIKKSKKRQEAT